MKKILISAFVMTCSIMTLAQTRVEKSQTPEERLNDQYCTGLFKSAKGTILDLQNEPGASAYFNILTWLEGRVAGLRVYTKNGTKVPYIRGQETNIYVDEIQVNASYLNAFPTSDIAMIKVIKSPFFGGFNAGGGAIAIYTIGAEVNDESNDGKYDTLKPLI
jgi:hypothetical protein